jgi:uroporphyrinogen decarboxylase
MIQNDSFLRACFREPTPHTPVWLMRQAGRYLPEYRASRAKAGSFMQLCQSPSFCAEVTLQPIDRYPLDAAIVFSDILTVPDAMGLGLSFAEGEGPRFASPVRTEADVLALAVPDMAKLRYVFDAISACRKAINNRVPLIGFSGSPFTLACYMTQGQGAEGYPLTKQLLYQRPDLFERILQINTETVIAYLTEQIKAGAQALMVFDSWGGVLSPADYRRYSLAPMQRLLAALPRSHDGQRIPLILFSKGAGGHSLTEMAGSGADVVGLDWTVDMASAMRQVGSQVALQGNIDPLLLTSNETAVKNAALACLDGANVLDTPTGHIFNLGHGITPQAQPDLVRFLIDTVHAYRPHTANAT